MTPSQLVDIAFKAYNTWEARKIELAVLFLEAEWWGQKKKGDPKGKKGGPLGTNQCAYCKEEGHWRRKFPKLKRESGDEKSHQETLKRWGESDDKWGGPGTPFNISWPATISPQEPWVQLMVGKPVDFLLNAGATYLVLNMKLTKKAWIQKQLLEWPDNYKDRHFFNP